MVKFTTSYKKYTQAVLGASVKEMGKSFYDFQKACNLLLAKAFKIAVWSTFLCELGLRRFLETIRSSEVLKTSQTVQQAQIEDQLPVVLQDMKLCRIRPN